MIGGVVVDLLLLGAVVAFSWGAAQLGGLTAIGRLIEAVAAFLVAVMLRDPVGSLVHALIGSSEDFANLVGVLLAGLGTWIAVNRLYRWWRTRRAEARSDEDGIPLDDVPDRLDSVLVARVAGGLLGLGWALLFVALLVMQPADNVVSRSAVASRVGGIQIHREHFLQWLMDGFPHYAQTLPKGKLGAVVGEQSKLPMRAPIETDPVPKDARVMLREINDLRRSQRVRQLAFNPAVAGVASRHALTLVQDQRLSYVSAGGAKLDGRVVAALGESASEFDDEIGEEVVWAHDPATAMRGLLASSRSRSLLSDAGWTEIGIGVVDAGWFNGRIYVLLLVRAITPEDAGVSAADTSSDDEASPDAGVGADAIAGTGTPDGGQPDAGAAPDDGVDHPVFVPNT